MKNKTYIRIAVMIAAICFAAGITGCGSDKEKADANVQTDTQEEYYEDEYSDEDSDQYDEDTYDTEDGEESHEYIMESDTIGITYDLPEEYNNTTGLLEYGDTDFTGYGKIFFAEMDYVGISREDYYNGNGNGISDEEFADHLVPLFKVIAVYTNTKEADLIEAINALFGDDIKEDDLNQLAENDDFRFFEYTGFDTSNYKNLDSEYKAEYDKLFALKDEVLKNASYSRPPTAADPDDDDKVSFTAVDFDGDTITSDKIFSQHEITMVNIWATWCGNCTGELAELEEINTRIAAKDCAIVGLCGDAVDDDSLNNAKALLSSNGVTYLNIRPFDDWYDEFDIEGCWPTSFFVDRNGKIIGKPVVGAEVDTYEKHIDELLKGGEVAQQPRTNTYENSDNVYRIRVVDEDLQAVEGAMVQLCTDEACKMGMTGSDGTVTFDDPPAVYEVHVRKVPQGYKEHTTTYKTEDHYCDMVIVIEKE